jgi:hypothetical protein
MNKQLSLNKRIDVALQPEATVTSADLAALIDEIEAEIAQADQMWSDDETISQAALNATLRANGLRPMLSQLQARYERVHETEYITAYLAKREAAWKANYDTVKRERDALAEELREVYPDAARRIADLFARIAANDRAVDDINRTRPDGVEQHLVSAEFHARERKTLSSGTPSLLQSVRLLDWDSGTQICPPQRPSTAAAFAVTPAPSYDRRFTADWAKDNGQRAAAQRVEQQRMAEYYTRLTDEQEARQNAEARESFLAQQQRLSLNRPLKP